MTCSVCNGSKLETVNWLKIGKNGKKRRTCMQVRCTHCFGTGREPEKEAKQ